MDLQWPYSSQWFYYSAEFIPALFIILFSIIFELHPIRLTDRILGKICKAQSQSCPVILKQKALFEYGAVSLVLAIGREAIQNHGYMSFFGFLVLVIFLAVGYFWLTVHRTRSFTWVGNPFHCFVYVIILVGMSLTISTFGAEIEGQASVIAELFYHSPLLFFVIIALAMFSIVLYLQLKKARIRMLKSPPHAPSVNTPRHEPTS